MKTLDTWASRPHEEAFLFNPAFVGLIICEFVKTYSKNHEYGTPLTLLPVTSAIVFHRPTRKKLPPSTVTSFYEWIQRNEDILIGLDERARDLTPYVLEACSFLLLDDRIYFSSGHHIVMNGGKGVFPPKFLKDTTEEVREIVSKVQFFSRWMAKSGSEATVLASLGVRP